MFSEGRGLKMFRGIKDRIVEVVNHVVKDGKKIFLCIVLGVSLFLLTQCGGKLNDLAPIFDDVEIEAMQEYTGNDGDIKQRFHVDIVVRDDKGPIGIFYILNDGERVRILTTESTVADVSTEIEVPISNDQNILTLIATDGASNVTEYSTNLIPTKINLGINPMGLYIEENPDETVNDFHVEQLDNVNLVIVKYPIKNMGDDYVEVDATNKSTIVEKTINGNDNIVLPKYGLENAIYKIILTKDGFVKRTDWIAGEKSSNIEELLIQNNEYFVKFMDWLLHMPVQEIGLKDNTTGKVYNNVAINFELPDEIYIIDPATGDIIEYRNVRFEHFTKSIDPLLGILNYYYPDKEFKIYHIDNIYDILEFDEENQRSVVKKHSIVVGQTRYGYHSFSLYLPLKDHVNEYKERVTAGGIILFIYPDDSDDVINICEKQMGYKIVVKGRNDTIEGFGVDRYSILNWPNTPDDPTRADDALFFIVSNGYVRPGNLYPNQETTINPETLNNNNNLIYVFPMEQYDDVNHEP